MAKFELSLSKNYVSHWGFKEAVRELFQNSLDQQKENPENLMFCMYEDGKLLIGNKDSVLETNTLLLGETTKADKNLIGQFGEGYKLALLVLCRIGKPVKIFNYGRREVWTPRLSLSKKYDATILVIDVDKKFPWQSVPDNNLVFEISNVSDVEYEEIKSIILDIDGKKDYSCIKSESDKGEILTDVAMQGHIFVDGLFVMKRPDFNYGYNLSTQLIKLDRDRKVVNDFDLRWATSLTWADTHSEKLIELIEQGAPEVAFVDSFPRSQGKFVDIMVDKFVKEFGHLAVPVSTQADVEKIQSKKYKPVVINSLYNSLLSRSATVRELRTAAFTREVDMEDALSQSPRDLLATFKTALFKAASDESCYNSLFDQLLDISEKWCVKESKDGNITEEDEDSK